MNMLFKPLHIVPKSVLVYDGGKQNQKLFDMTTKNVRLISALAISMHALFFSGNAMGQRLIENGDFETRTILLSGDTACPSMGGGIAGCEAWGSARGSVDYLHACANSVNGSERGVPNNIFGYQDDAGDGQAYVHITCYAEIYSNAREYLWIELSDSLTENMRYHFQFQLSLADSSNYAIDNIGALFSKENPRAWEKEDFFEQQPQIESKGRSLSNAEEWETIEGEFVAEGGELFLTIGTYVEDSQLSIQRLNSYGPEPYYWEASLYYIDEVELDAIGFLGVEAERLVKTSLFPNPTSGQLTLEYRSIDGKDLQWVITDLQGRVLHAQPLIGLEGKAYLEVDVADGIYMSTILIDRIPSASEKLIVH